MDFSPEEAYLEFLNFCSQALKGEDPKFLELIKKRFSACSEEFRNSEKMVRLLKDTQTNMQNEVSRMFVHLKDLLTELKASSSSKGFRKQKLSEHKKRSFSPDSGTKVDCNPKPPKLMNCSVILTKADDSDGYSSPVDVYLDTARDNSCSISDGNVNNAMEIHIADSENDAHLDISSAKRDSRVAASTRKFSTFFVDCSGSPDIQVIQVTPRLTDDSSLSHKQKTFEEKSEACLLNKSSSTNSTSLLSPCEKDELKNLNSNEENSGVSNSIEKASLNNEFPDKVSDELTCPDTLDSTVLKIQDEKCVSHSNILQSEPLSDVKPDEDSHNPRKVNQDQEHVLQLDPNPGQEKMSQQPNVDTQVPPFSVTDSVKSDRVKEPKRGSLLPVETSKATSSGKFSELFSSKKREVGSVSGPPRSMLSEVPSEDEFQQDSKDDKEKGLPNQRHVRKLEHLLESLRNEIEKCQAREMTLDDLEDETSSYIYEDKLKKKFVAAWKKLCEITSRSVSTGRPTERTIKFNGTRYKEINRRLERFLNRKKIFPDFYDVKNIIKLTNKKYKMNMSAMMINDTAREAFVDIGEMLQTRRHQDFIATFGNRHTDSLRSGVDPYLTDQELRRKLDSNRKIARSNLDQVIAKYSKLQYEREDEEDEDDKEDEESNDDAMEDTKDKYKDCSDGEDGDGKLKRKFHGTSGSNSKVVVEEEKLSKEKNEHVVPQDSGEEPATLGTSKPKYNPYDLKLGENLYLGDTEPPAVDSFVKALGLSPFASNINQHVTLEKDVITIEDSPAKLEVPDTRRSLLNSFNKELSSIPTLDKKVCEEEEKKFALLRSKPNLRFTARKVLPLPAVKPKAERIHDDDDLTLGHDDDDVSIISYEEIAKENAEDTDDQSSDSSHEDDDEDDEDIMVIDSSVSESDSEGSNVPSPVSVISLGSSFDDSDRESDADRPISKLDIKTSPKSPKQAQWPDNNPTGLGMLTPTRFKEHPQFSDHTASSISRVLDLASASKSQLKPQAVHKSKDIRKSTEFLDLAVHEKSSGRNPSKTASVNDGPKKSVCSSSTDADCIVVSAPDAPCATPDHTKDKATRSSSTDADCIVVSAPDAPCATPDHTKDKATRSSSTDADCIVVSAPEAPCATPEHTKDKATGSSCTDADCIVVSAPDAPCATPDHTKDKATVVEHEQSTSLPCNSSEKIDNPSIKEKSANTSPSKQFPKATRPHVDKLLHEQPAESCKVDLQGHVSGKSPEKKMVSAPKLTMANDDSVIEIDDVTEETRPACIKAPPTPAAKPVTGKDTDDCVIVIDESSQDVPSSSLGHPAVARNGFFKSLSHQPEERHCVKKASRSSVAVNEKVLLENLASAVSEAPEEGEEMLSEDIIEIDCAEADDFMQLDIINSVKDADQSRGQEEVGACCKLISVVGAGANGSASYKGGQGQTSREDQDKDGSLKPPKEKMQAAERFQHNVFVDSPRTPDLFDDSPPLAVGSCTDTTSVEKNVESICVDSPEAEKDTVESCTDTLSVEKKAVEGCTNTSMVERAVVENFTVEKEVDEVATCKVDFPDKADLNTGIKPVCAGEVIAGSSTVIALEKLTEGSSAKEAGEADSHSDNPVIKTTPVKAPSVPVIEIEESLDGVLDGPSDKSPLDKPSDKSPLDGPSDKSPLDKPSDKSPLDGPSDKSPLDKPSDKSPLDGPSDKSPLNKPSDKSPLNKPSDKSPLDKPSDKSPLDMPSDKSPLDGPSDKSPLNEPSIKSPLDKPSDKSPLDEPNNKSPLDESTNESRQNEVESFPNLFSLVEDSANSPLKAKSEKDIACIEETQASGTVLQVDTSSPTADQGGKETQVQASSGITPVSPYVACDVGSQAPSGTGHSPAESKSSRQMEEVSVEDIFKSISQICEQILQNGDPVADQDSPSDTPPVGGSPTDTPRAGDSPTDTPPVGGTPVGGSPTDTPRAGGRPTDTPPVGGSPTDTPHAGDSPTDTPPDGGSPAGSKQEDTATQTAPVAVDGEKASNPEVESAETSLTQEGELVKESSQSPGKDVNNDTQNVDDPDVNPENIVSLNLHSKEKEINKESNKVDESDEDEVEIVEELCSARGTRLSVKTKEDDRKLVDNFLKDPVMLGAKKAANTSPKVPREDDTVKSSLDVNSDEAKPPEDLASLDMECETVEKTTSPANSLPSSPGSLSVKYGHVSKRNHTDIENDIEETDAQVESNNADEESTELEIINTEPVPKRQKLDGNGVSPSPPLHSGKGGNGVSPSPPLHSGKGVKRHLETSASGTSENKKVNDSDLKKTEVELKEPSAKRLKELVTDDFIKDLISSVYKEIPAGGKLPAKPSTAEDDDVLVVAENLKPSTSGAALRMGPSNRGLANRGPAGILSPTQGLKFKPMVTSTPISNRVNNSNILRFKNSTSVMRPFRSTQSGFVNNSSRLNNFTGSIKPVTSNFSPFAPSSLGSRPRQQPSAPTSHTIPSLNPRVPIPKINSNAESLSYRQKNFDRRGQVLSAHHSPASQVIPPYVHQRQGPSSYKNSVRPGPQPLPYRPRGGTTVPSSRTPVKNLDGTEIILDDSDGEDEGGSKTKQSTTPIRHGSKNQSEKFPSPRILSVTSLSAASSKHSDRPDTRVASKKKSGDVIVLSDSD